MRLSFAALVTLLVTSAGTGCSRENHDWEAARRANDPVSYRAFIARYPAGEHTAEARGALEAQAWSQAGESVRIDRVEAFLREFPGSVHRSEAIAIHERLSWQDALSNATEERFRAYLSVHPDGAHSAEARQRLRRIEAGQLPRVEGTVSELSMGFFRDGRSLLLDSRRVSRTLAYYGLLEAPADEMERSRNQWEVMWDDSTILEGVDTRNGKPVWFVGRAYRAYGESIPDWKMSPVQQRRSEIGVRVMRAALIEPVTE